MLLKFDKYLQLLYEKVHEEKFGGIYCIPELRSVNG